MEPLIRMPVLGLFALVALFLLIVPARADDFNTPYCSTQNTAGDFQALSWDWQSNGWCHDQCNSKGTYAFAVIKWKQCWCSNYIPEDQEDTSKCDVDCPGFPSEKCGDNDKGLYIYVQLDGKPSGTQTTAQPTSANPSSAPPSPVSTARETSRDPETVIQTVTASAPVVTVIPTSSEKSSEPSSTLETSASSPSSSASDGEPVTSIRTLTQSGAIVTETLVITPAPTSPSPAVTGHGTSKSNTGAIVGGVVGGIAGVAAIVGGVFFLLWRRRRQQQQRQEEEDFQTGVQRNTSTMSKAGLLRGEKVPQYPPRIATTFSSRHSRTLDTESISPVSGSDRRSSRPYIFDQRLNPSAIMNLDNTSRGSFASMDDARDYGRTLNVRNPDPDQH